MKETDFWERVEQRVEENKVIVGGGMPARWAPVMETVGLHFWKIGLVLSLGLAGYLWRQHYPFLVGAVRVMIWR